MKNKTKVVIKKFITNKLSQEYEVLVDNPDIKHGFHKSYWFDGKTIYYEDTYINNLVHGERKVYNFNGEYNYSVWYFEGEHIGHNQEGKKEFERLNKPYIFLENCKKFGI